MIEISPAILTNNQSDFNKQYAELLPLAHFFKRLHVDFIDGKFLPQQTLMPGDSCRVKAPFIAVAHLMTFNPKQYFAILKNGGYSEVIVHFEAFDNPQGLDEALQLAQLLGLKISLAINPETKLITVGKYLREFNRIHLMSVHPGKQGSEFVPGTLDKIRELKALRKDAIISVDGGINPGTAKECAEAGADILVVGSYIARSHHPKEALEELVAVNI